MTKKHFKAIAEIIKYEVERSRSDISDRYLSGRHDATRDIALSLTSFCATKNPRFDRAKFLTACGIE